MTGFNENIIPEFSSLNERLILKYLRRLLLVTVYVFSLVFNVAGQIIGDYGSAAPGPNNWSNAASWVICAANGTWAGATPAAGSPANPNNVWIRSGHTINLDAVARTCNNLTVQGGGLLGGNQFISIYGNLVVDGSINTTASIRLYGTSINGSGSITTSSQFRIYNTNKTIIAGANLDFNCSIQFRSPNLTITNSGSVSIYNSSSISENFAAGCIWDNAANSYLGFDGNISSAVALSASASGNTVEYFGAGAQDVKVPVSSYYHLTTSNANIKTLLGDITFLGNVLIGAGTTLDVSWNNYDITVEGNWTHDGVFNENNGTVIFSGANNQTIEGNPDETFYNLTVNKSAGIVQPINSSTNIFVDNDFVITAGTFETGGNNLSVINNSTIAGTLSTNDITAIADLNNVVFAGGTIGSSANTGTVNISGDLTLSSGNGTIARVNLYVTGTTTIPATRTLNFTNVNGIKRFSGTVTNNGSWNNSTNEDIEFRNGLTHSGTSFNSGTGTYSFTTNNQTLGGTSNITFDGNVTVTGITLNNAKTTTIKGILGGTGTWNNNNGSVLNYENSTAPMAGGSFNVSTNSNTVNYSGSGNQTIKTTTYHRLIVSNSGNKTFTGTLTINENLNIENNAVLQNSGSNDIYLAGNWTDNNAADGFSEGTGEVFFNGTSQQTVTKAGGSGSENFFDLTMNNSNGLLMASGDMVISNRFAFASGNIAFTNNSFKVYLTAGTPASMNYTSVTGSRIIGKFERGINAAGTFLFPIGTAANYNPANVTINSLASSGSVVSEFIGTDPGDSGLPLVESGIEVSDSYTDGYWSLTANNGFSSGNYNISLNGTGFSTPIYDITRVIKRTSGGNWGFDGTHANASGSVCYRNNLTGGISSSGTHFGFGHTRPKITDDPDNQTICAGSTATFSITATGYAPLTYQWYKSPNILLVEDAHFTGTTLATLNIVNVIPGDAGDYYCVVTDGHGKIVQSNPATLAVFPQPVAPTLNTRTPNLAAVCDGQTVSATFNAGSGGVGCTDAYQYRFDGAGGWNSYTPGNNLNTTGHTLVEIQGQRSGCTAGAGCSGTAWVTLASWTVNPQPTGPTLNLKSPNLAAVCDGQTVSATFNAGSGGVGCTDAYQYRFDGAGGWNSYTPGNNLNTTGHTLVEIQGQRSGCTAGAGCSGTAWVTLASWTVNPQPTGPTLNLKTPNLAAVCDGQTVSATFNAGSGGVGCTDAYQYRFDGAGGWNSYTPGNNLNTTGHTLVEIQGQRSGCDAGTGCSGTAWVTLASWTVNPQPTGPTLNLKTPNLAAVCDGQTVSATFNAGSGGVGCTDAYQYRFDGAGGWNSYTPGNNLNTTGHTLVEIQGQRSGCTAGAGCSGTAWVTLASWTVNPQPTGPTLNLKTPNLATVCDGQTVSATFNAGSGGIGCTDAYQYRFDGAGGWNSYTPGNNLNTAGHTLVEIQGQRSGCTAGAGCSGTAWVTLASWTVNPQPTGPTLNTRTPNLATVCDGQTVSATFNAGSGGVGCTDAYQYRFDGAGGWNSYTPGNNLNTTGHTLVEIQGQRSGCTAGAGCSGTAWVTLASWTVNPQPTGPTLNYKDSEPCSSM